MNLHLPGRDPLRSVIIAFTLMLAVFLGGVLQRATGVFTPVDHAVQALVAPIQFSALTALMKLVTMSGEAGGLTVIVAMTYFAGRRAEATLLLLLVLFAGTGLNDHMKHWFALPRPTAAETAQLYTAGGFGYPSGHSVSGVCLAWLAYRLRGRNLVLCAGIALLMAFSRIYLGVHYFSDTVGGVVHGVAWLYFAGAIVAMLGHLPVRESDPRSMRRALLGGAVAAAIVYGCIDPAPEAGVRYVPMLLGAGVGMACVPRAWAPVSRARFAVISVIGVALVGGVRVGLGAVLPDAALAHVVRYTLVGLVLGASPLLFIATGLAAYRVEEGAGAETAGAFTPAG